MKIRKLAITAIITLAVIIAAISGWHIRDTSTPSSTTVPTQVSTSNDNAFSGVSQSFSLFPENINGNSSATSAGISVQTIPLTLDNPDQLPVLK